MKKIALIFSTKLTNPNGASAVMRSLYNNKGSFQRNGIELNLYSPDNILKENNLVVKSDPKTKKKFSKKIIAYIKNNVPKNNLYAIASILISGLRPASRIIRQYDLVNNNEDILFFHEIFTCYKYIKHRKNKKNKIILVLHNNGDTFAMVRKSFPEIEKSFFYKYLLRIEKKVLHEVDKLGYVAEYPLKNFIKLNPNFNVNKLFFVHNGLSQEEKIKRNSNSFKIEICCVGTICERKGQRFIVEALAKLKKEQTIPDIHFSIIGGGEIEKELIGLSEKFGLSEHISFEGSSDKINSFLYKSNIFILPSTDEGLPIAIIEAMRASLPIVSTKVGGIPEMIKEGETGIFIEPSTTGVYDFLINIDKYNWMEMGKKSNNLFLNKFTDDKMINSYSRILKSL